MTKTGSYQEMDYDEGWQEHTPRAAHRPGAPGSRQQPPRRRRGSGCISTFIFLAVVVVLVAVALLLPPFSLLERLTGAMGYEALDAANPSFSHPRGLTLSVDINNPGDGFAVRVGAYDAHALVEGQGDAAVRAAYANIPSHLALHGPVFELDTRGRAPASFLVQVPAPSLASADSADVYAWQGERWEFVPARLSADGANLSAQLDHVPQSLAVFEARALPPVLTTVIDPQDMMTDEAALALNMVFPAGLQPEAGTGALSGGLAPGFRQDAGYLVIPVIRNFTDPDFLDVMTVADLLRSDEAREAHITALRGFAVVDDYDGVAIDYRGLPPEYRDAFSGFIRELARRLHADGRLLVVFVPAAVEDGPGWNTGVYDWRALGRAADAVVVALPPNPAQYGPGGLAERMLKWAVDEIDRYKILADLSTLSVRQVGERFEGVPYQVAFEPLGGVTLLTEGVKPESTEDAEEAEETEADDDAPEPVAGEVYFLPGSTIEVGLSAQPRASGEDADTGAAYVEFGDGERVWITTEDAFRRRLEALLAFNLGGWNIAHLLSDGNLGDMLNVAVEVQGSVPPVGRDDPLALRWTVRSAAGDAVVQAVAGLSTPFVWTADEEGEYTISAELEGQAAGRRGEVSVRVAAPTPTPTPEPTNTPAPVAAGGGGGGGAPAPVAPAGSFAVGSFELGGHVDGYPPVAQMQQAGMRWVKYQVRYTLGSDPGVAAGYISAAQGAGFKVLLGVVGYPHEMAAVGLDSYIQQFASFLGGVAALGPNAIEVWNEPNIDREWPNGQISGESYTRMLAAAYNAIKGVNSGVMVISGAPAPTGYAGAGGTSAAVWNDDVFYQSMANAGAANYMDCIGAHYNEGIVPPDWTSGDPRGGYPTYYFQSMTNRAWAPFGGSRPVCYTELGYLTPEGFGALPGGFAWAQNVTLAQQAEWLARAAVIAANSGRVRLMIIWNVNFSRFDADPMAGYAIIRPDGSCPACQTLGSVR